MKCKLIRELEVSEASEPPEALLEQCVRRDGKLFAPIGTIINDPNCHFLVKNCDAEAADEECAAITKRRPSDLVPMTAWEHSGEGFKEITLPAIEWSRLRLARGIHEDDFEAYAAGKILGYTPNGDYIPGPNWTPIVDDEDDEEEPEGQ